MSEWIKCCERMPEEFQQVLTTWIGYYGHRYYSACQYSDGSFMQIFRSAEVPAERVSHWMPLPTPPEQSEMSIEAMIALCERAP